jgi:phosphoglycolate phosphatase/putative hydrolase of the HAD superfamily
LAALRARGVQVGVFSDYPVADKLDRLRVRTHVSLELDATTEDINAFKPHPRGLEVACARWGLPPDQVLYVGDRADVDAEAARRAGMRCAILGGRQRSNAPADWFQVDHVGQLLAHVTTPDGIR